MRDRLSFSILFCSIQSDTISQSGVRLHIADCLPVLFRWFSFLRSISACWTCFSVQNTSPYTYFPRRFSFFYYFIQTLPISTAFLCRLVFSMQRYSVRPAVKYRCANLCVHGLTGSFPQIEDELAVPLRHCPSGWVFR